MTLQQALRAAVRCLKATDQIGARLEAEVLLAWASGYSRPQLLARLEKKLIPAVAAKFKQAIKQRSAGYPLQYITGRQEFMSLDFKVNPSVLIPRQDTEVLVTAVLQRLKADGSYLIADCGTGSGAIVLSLANYLPSAFFYATDLSSAALAVAIQNAHNLGLEKRVTFCQGDFLTPLSGLRLDVITANPPYIPSLELKKLASEIHYEPSLALDGGSDGLAAYRMLLPGAAKLLKPNGLLALEIGYNQGQEVKKIAVAVGAYRDLALLQDYNGRDRCFIAYRT